MEDVPNPRMVDRRGDPVAARVDVALMRFLPLLPAEVRESVDRTCWPIARRSATLQPNEATHRPLPSRARRSSAPYEFEPSQPMQCIPFAHRSRTSLVSLTRSPLD
jgi:hypothetical protein